MAAANPPVDPPFFFILSRPRTGSTLLRTMLDAHPDTLVPPECQFVVNLYPKYGRTRGWTRERLVAFTADLAKEPLFRTWQLDIRELRKRLLSDSPPASYADLCRAVYLSYRSFYDKGQVLALGDKNPGHVLHLSLLRKLYPDARFIHLLRDYRDNHLSLVKAGFEFPSIGYTTAKWVHFYRLVARHEARAPSQFLTLHYENLVADPGRELARVCNFIGVDFDERMLNYYRKKEQLLTAYRGTRFEELHSGILEPPRVRHIGLWRNQLDRHQVNVADFVAGTVGDQAGYTGNTESSSLSVVLAGVLGILMAKTNYVALKALDALPPSLKKRVTTSLTGLLESWWRKLALRKPH